MGDLSIRVLDSDEEPLEHIPVAIEFTELTRGMAHEHTDREGYAYFSGYEEGPIRVYVDHKNYGEYGWGEHQYNQIRRNKMGNLDIFVLNKREEPLRGIKVSFQYISRCYDDGGRGSFFDVQEGWGGEARTDKKGNVYFNNVREKGLLKFYLNDKFAGRGGVYQKRITFNMGRRERYDDGQSGYQMRSG